MSHNPNIRAVQYQGKPFWSGYATSMLDSAVGFSIGSNKGPFTINITPQLGDTDKKPGILVTFISDDKAPKSVLLPKETFVPLIAQRVEYKDKYNAAVKSGGLTAQHDADDALTIHHDICANRLEECLAENGIKPTGHRCAKPQEGEAIAASLSTRALIGTVTDALAPMLKRINPKAGVGRVADQDS